MDTTDPNTPDPNTPDPNSAGTNTPGYRDQDDQDDLLDGVDPLPVYEPALIDIDEDVVVIDVSPVNIDAGADIDVAVIEVEDTLMAGDDYGDVP